VAKSRAWLPTALDVNYAVFRIEARMSPLARFRQVAACTALAFVFCSAVAEPPKPVVLAANVPAVIAHSALLDVEATAKAEVLQISLRRVADKSLVNTDDITVAVDGKNEPVTHERGTIYEVAVNDLRGEGVKDVDVTVAHDGIREILSGKVSLAEAPAGSLLRDHKQVAWWVLNIVIVLIAAMAFSRKKPASAEKEEEEES
jgi:hypothetical protein